MQRNGLYMVFGDNIFDRSYRVGILVYKCIIPVAEVYYYILTGTKAMEGTPDVEATEDDTDLSAKSFSKVIGAIKRPFQHLFGASSEPPVWDPADEYDFTHSVRGNMIVINNEYFKNHSPRPGSDIDVNFIDKTFTGLGFNVICYNNQTRDQMFKILKKVAKSDHTNADCFACAILSHGDEVHVVDKREPGKHEREDLVYAIDQIVLTREIVELFRDEKCPSLLGKPRLFFIQACRGNMLDSGADVTVLGEDQVDSAFNKHYEVRPSPLYKDSLIMYATPPGYYAFRRPDTGSWFIKGLCEVMSKPEAGNQPLTKLLTSVIRLVAVKNESRSANLKISGKKQTPCFVSMLTKDVYFKQKST